MRGFPFDILAKGKSFQRESELLRLVFIGKPCTATPDVRIKKVDFSYQILC